MAGDTANPRVWVNADVYVAPTGSTAPTNIASALDAAYEPVGLLSEDGLTESRELSSEDKFAYGGILVRTVRSKFKRTIKVICLEDNPVVFDLVNPGDVGTTATGITTRNVHVPNTPNQKAFVIQTVDGDITRRRVVPTGEVTEVGDTQIQDSELSAYELTITVYPDADGLLYVDITDDPQAEV